MRVEPARVLPAGFADLPTDAARIAVVVSLTFPGMTDQTLELMERFTRTALETLLAAGARAVLVDSAAAELLPAAELDAFDGVLFLGGGDVDGALYGHHDPVPHSYGVDRRADEYCLELIRGVLERDQPLLAICRGSQMLNVACGGTLIADLDPWHLHRGGPDEPMFLDETIRLLPGSKVAAIMGSERITVRSGHHQAVATVGPELITTAVADDGVVEGTEHPGKTWVVGVQWHPEDSDGNEADRMALFAEFVRSSRKEQGRKGGINDTVRLTGSVHA
ncbi:gamma-glutamyl-gamma-aminobutyrate hydrolase family protein [Arthrobacter sp. CAU 1506]|uniref:gamma-glutamyl-gamma-aminobutyrate hydrolase family protein n=1 Tax=Arthrobacter sp. CAU 1506 TaxID=2560052 RepID=UPI0010ABB636|nr:gamma-glutamyl-gamma-aminobutyrate hydrolase family protein [Arthrobacter sp. CAU 1506]TJY72560.1 gamma-glutamyl-gamma-aminobutyrate hydrolase family protein [Arthrobacter sp. CAU 1506]